MRYTFSNHRSPKEIVMAFKATAAMVDIINGTASVVAFDQPASGPAKTMVQVNFPFHPPGQEKQQVIDAAKKVLQQALNEI
jgi:hypothetical protein